MTNFINIGDLRRVTAAFTDALGVATDPTGVVLYVRKPGALSATTYNYPADPIIVKDSTGNYHADLAIDTEGAWHYEWAGTGAVTADEEDSFYVSAQRTRAVP